MKEADCHNNFENAILFQSQLILAQHRHFTELKTRNSIIKLKAIAKGSGYGLFYLQHAATVLTLGMKEWKPEKTEHEAHEKVLFIVHCGEFE